MIIMVICHHHGHMSSCYPSLVTSFMLSNFNTFQPIDHSIYPFIHPSIYPSIHRPHLSVTSLHHIYPFIIPTITFIDACIHLSPSMQSIHASIHHIYQSIHLSIHLSIHPIYHIHPSIISIYPPIYCRHGSWQQVSSHPVTCQACPDVLVSHPISMGQR